MKKAKLTPLEKEWGKVINKELAYINKRMEKSDSGLNRMLEKKIPKGLQNTLDTAFAKAFRLVFEKGTGIIQKAGRQEVRREKFQVNEVAVEACEDRTNLKAFSKAAGKAGAGNLAVSGVAGVGMGLFGVALPDIPLFTAMLLKSVYETAESYGFPCEGEEEQLYALRVMEAALSYGEELREKSRMLDIYAQTGLWPEEADKAAQIKASARKLSEAVLYAKALQNVPVVGAVGGAGDAVCLSRVQKYAEIKYHKRFLIRRRSAE